MEFNKKNELTLGKGEHMYNDGSIIQLTNITEYKFSDELQEALKDIQWRLHSNNFLELFAQIEGKIIIGIGISWLNAFHPHAKYIRVVSMNNFESLIEKLLHTISPQEHVIYSCWSDDIASIQFLQNWDFQLFRKTYMETYNVNDLVAKMPTYPSSATLLSLKEVLQQPKLVESLFQLVKLNYEKTHLHNPVKNMTWRMWKEDLLEDTPDLQLSYIALEQNEVVAYIFLHPISDPVYEVGWVGTSTDDFDLHIILTKQLHKLKRKGILNVAFEVDTTDVHAWEFAELLTLKKKKSLNSYMHKPNLV